MKSSSSSAADVFWGEVSPCEHLVQFYTDESHFMVSLGRFVTNGFRDDEAVVVIATASHLATLEGVLRAQGFDLEALRAARLYTALDAAATLSLFMRDGWPDDERQQAEWHAWTDHDSVRTAHKGIPGRSVPSLRRTGLRMKEGVQNGRARRRAGRGERGRSYDPPLMRR